MTILLLISRLILWYLITGLASALFAELLGKAISECEVGKSKIGSQALTVLVLVLLWPYAAWLGFKEVVRRMR